MTRSSERIGRLGFCAAVVFVAVYFLPTIVSAGPDGYWQPGPGAPLMEGRPGGRMWHAAAADPAGGRMFVIGGYPGDTGYLWMLDLTAVPPTWHRLAAGSPGPGDRIASALAYDSSRNRLLLMGGDDASGSQYYSDVWQYRLDAPATWEQIPVTGVRPAERSWHGALYDSLRDRLVIVGGETQFDYLDDAWALSLSGDPEWKRLGTSGAPPTPRSRATVIYDPVGDRVFRYGGRFSVEWWGDLWMLSLADSGTWTPLSPIGSTPGSRQGMAGAFDPLGHRLLFYGGFTGSAVDGTYSLELGDTLRWHQLTPATTPGGRGFGSAVMDTARGRMVLFGGIGAGYPPDAWALDLKDQTWSMLPTRGTPDHPTVRADLSLTSSSSRPEMYLVGGYDNDNAYGRNDVWRLDLNSTPAWSQVFPIGADALPGRQGHVAVIDEATPQIVVFGGGGPFGSSNDTWALSLNGLPAWRPVLTMGPAPPAEEERGAIYDAIRRRMIVVGYRSTGGWDVWALPLDDMSSWIDLTNVAPSPIRTVWGNSAVYDRAADRLVVLGGEPNSEVWALSLGGTPTWTQLYSGPGPSVRGEHAVTLDTRRRRILLSGGHAYGADLEDLWEFDLAGTPSWRLLSPTGPSPLPRAFHGAAYDSVYDRMVLFGGHNGAYLGDTWYLQFDVTTAALVTAVRALPGANMVDISWYAERGVSRAFRVERADGDEPWRDVGRTTSDGSGLLHFRDTELLTDHEYAYRLAWEDSRTTVHGGEITIRTSKQPQFELLRVGPNPTRGETTVTFAVADSRPVEIAVVDVTGRRWFARRLTNVEPGVMDTRLSTGSLPTGMYIVTLDQAGNRKVVRLAVVR